MDIPASQYLSSHASLSTSISSAILVVLIACILWLSTLACGGVIGFYLKSVIDFQASSKSNSRSGSSHRTEEQARNQRHRWRGSCHHRYQCDDHHQEIDHEDMRKPVIKDVGHHRSHSTQDGLRGRRRTDDDLANRVEKSLRRSVNPNDSPEERLEKSHQQQRRFHERTVEDPTSLTTEIEIRKRLSFDRVTPSDGNVDSPLIGKEEKRCQPSRDTAAVKHAGELTPSSGSSNNGTPPVSDPQQPNEQHVPQCHYEATCRSLLRDIQRYKREMDKGSLNETSLGLSELQLRNCLHNLRLLFEDLKLQCSDSRVRYIATMNRCCHVIIGFDALPLLKSLQEDLGGAMEEDSQFVIETVVPHIWQL